MIRAQHSKKKVQLQIGRGLMGVASLIDAAPMIACYFIPLLSLENHQSLHNCTAPWMRQKYGGAVQR